MARAPALQEIETFPEADRLDGVPHPRFTSKLYGQVEAERELAEGLASGRLHHGWLLAGTAGIGKATLAWRFARCALSDADERDSAGRSLAVSSETAGSRQVRALSHPRLLLLRRPYQIKEKRFAGTITIDEVRRLRQFLSLGAEPGAWRCVIVDSADDLNPNAANALLKSLEEPPARTVFLLITSQPGRLLPTIRSRCRLLPMPELAHSELRRAADEALEAEGRPLPSSEDWNTLAALSGGSVRRALALHAGGGIALDETVSKQLAALPRVDWIALHTLADKLAPAAAEQQFELYYELLLSALSRAARSAATGGAGLLSARLAEDGRMARLAEAYEAIARARREADALNLDRKALMIDTFAILEKALR